MATPSATPATAPRILLIDDDEIMRRASSAVLRNAGYRVTTAVDGVEGLELLAKEGADLILLDVEMPRLDGWQALEQLRSEGHRQPVLMLTGRVDVDDKVRGLGIGADDYISKPCEKRELLARVNAALRRARPPEPDLPLLYFGAMVVDLANRSCSQAGTEVRLTKTEYAVLETLARRPGRTVTREVLLEKVWGYTGEVNTRTVETTLWRLRRKISDTAEDSRWLKTAPAGGYMLSGEVFKPAADLR